MLGAMRHLIFAVAGVVSAGSFVGACTTTNTTIIVQGNDSGASESGTEETGTPPPPGNDASTPSDGAVSDGAPYVCVPISPPPADAGRICASDGSAGNGICDGGGVATFTQKWIPPSGAHQNLCTAQDIDTYAQVCLGVQTDGGAACKSFEASRKTCTDCLLPSTITALGPLVPDGHFVSPNIAGCIALLEPCNEGCAHDVLTAVECGQAVCGACSQDANSSADMINGCDTTASNCGCAAYEAKAACEYELTGPQHPASICLQADFLSSFKAMAPIFCGP